MSKHPDSHRELDQLFAHEMCPDLLSRPSFQNIVVKTLFFFLGILFWLNIVFFVFYLGGSFRANLVFLCPYSTFCNFQLFLQYG